VSKHPITPATVAHIAAMLASHAECLKSGSDIIDYSRKTNRYRASRIKELTELAWDFAEAAVLVCEERKVTDDQP